MIAWRIDGKADETVYRRNQAVPEAEAFRT
jgi:hypothetical protein